MAKKGLCLGLIMLLAIFCRAQTTRKDNLIENIYSVKKDEPVKGPDSTYTYLVKTKTPLQEISNDIQLLKTVSYNYYIVSAKKQLHTDNTIEVISVSNSLWKATDDLALLSADRPNNTRLINLVVKSYSTSDLAAIRKFADVIGNDGNTITAKVRLKNLAELLHNDNIIFAGAVRQAHEELVIHDLDLGVNNISTVASDYPELNGSGINISVKEQRFDKTDLDLIGHTFESGISAPNESTHATVMATLIAGSGNSFIKGKGAAPAAMLTSSDFARLMPDSIFYFKNFSISAQNHSYGVGIENYYGIEAAAYDKQIFQADTIVHVFSAGNIGQTSPSTGLYIGITNAANLTGTFKQAKNVLVAGGTNRSDVPEALSSSGPAYDGRVKPEIVANGQDGTSGAAALVSGTVALVQQAFKKAYHHLPSSALVKCVLINAADDIGAPNVDFKTGYGKLNALEAIRTLNEGRFKSGSVNDQASISYQITVPAGCKTFKVSLAWNDPPTALNAPNALVNDLDLFITTPNGDTLLPWTLSTYPNIDSLLKPATRRRDDLNNTEQVNISNPIAGTYTIYVKGRRVSIGPQNFHIAYQSKSAARFKWTFPSSADKILAQETNYLRWENSFTSPGTISVSYDNGLTWQPIGTTDLSGNFYQWTPQNLFTKAKFKMDIGGQAFISDEFVISKPLSLNVGYNCTDGTLLHWQPQEGAVGYNLYTIKNNVLQQLSFTTDTSLIITPAMQSSNYYAVSAVGNGLEGVKSQIIDVSLQGVGCYVRALLANVAHEKEASLSLSLGSVLNLKSITWEKLKTADTYTALGTTSISTTDLNYVFFDKNPTEGFNIYRAKLTTTDGRVIYSDVATVIVLQTGQFAMYPNPVSRQLNILSGDQKDYELILYDMTGRLCYKKKFSNQQNVVDIDVISGVYICTINLNGTVVYKQKLIKI